MRIIDLFSGCGGLSQGFKMAGFDSVLAVEKDLWAAETYAYNQPEVKIYNEDITKIKRPGELWRKNEIDGIVGGPPCQGFSLSGQRDTKDPRNSLFMDFLRFVSAFHPKFFVIENVPGILSMRTQEGSFVRDIIANECRRVGYNVCTHILNAADYGVPQLRERVFFFGLRNDFQFIPSQLCPPAILPPSFYVTIREAISDLPVLSAGEGEEEQEYSIAPQNAYQKWVRTHSKKVYNHISMRHTPRLVERFKNISSGQSVKDVAREHAQRKRGSPDLVSGKVFSQNNMRPYPDRPSPTVAASFQSNFIHPLFDRNYSAREGARLQSFPDTYIFRGKRTTMSWEKNLSQYQQIGNAVPPLLARSIAERISWYFDNINNLEQGSVGLVGSQMAFL